MEGWFKVPRTVVLQPFFQNERMVKVWLWMMAKASHKEHTVMVGLTPVTLQAGQFVYGLHVACEELNIPQTTLYRMMKTFEKLGVITIKAEQRFSVVTLTDWVLSQFTAEQQRNDNGTTAETNKNGKNEKNGNRYIDQVQYAEFVSMTVDQHDKLVRDYGEDGAKKLIDCLNNHKGATGKTYKDDYYAILNWCVNAIRSTDRPYKKTNTFNNYTDEHADFSDCEKSALKRRKKSEE